MLPPVTVVGYDPVRPVSFQNDATVSARQSATGPSGSGMNVAPETRNPVLPVDPASTLQGTQRVQNAQDQGAEAARVNEPAGPPPAFEITLMEKREAEKAASVTDEEQPIPEEQPVTESADASPLDDASSEPKPQLDGANAQANEAYRALATEPQKPTIDITV